MQHVNKDIPPELQGVSVKELVKVIGESRANGNGVTPPDTPRRQLSRSASPSVATLQTAATVAGSRGSSPGSSLEASGAGPSPVQGHGHQRGRRSQIRSSQSPDPTALHVQRQDSDSLETITSGSVGQTTSKDSSMQAVPPSAPDGSVSAVAGRASTSREASPLTLDKDSVTQLPIRPSSSDRKKGQEAQRSSTLKPPTGLANIASFCLCFFLVKIIVWLFCHLFCLATQVY